MLADAPRDGRAAKREEAVASRAREREREAFQCETLIELQDWLGKLARTTGAIHHEDYMRYRESGKWGRESVAEKWNTGHHEATVNARR